MMIDVGSIAFGPEVERQPIIAEISRLREALMPDDGSPMIEVVYFIPGSLGHADFEQFEVRRSRSGNGRLLVHVAVPSDVAASDAPMPALIDLARSAIEFGTRHRSGRKSGASDVHDVDVLLASLTRAALKVSDTGVADTERIRIRPFEPTPHDQDHHEAGVIIRLMLGDNRTNLSAAFELEDRLGERLEATGIGYVDGNEVDLATFEIHAYGPEVQSLRGVVEPIVREHWIGKLATLRLFDGDQEVATLEL